MKLFTSRLILRSSPAPSPSIRSRFRMTSSGGKNNTVNENDGLALADFQGQITNIMTYSFIQKKTIGTRIYFKPLNGILKMVRMANFTSCRFYQNLCIYSYVTMKTVTECLLYASSVLEAGVINALMELEFYCWGTERKVFRYHQAHKPQFLENFVLEKPVYTEGRLKCSCLFLCF